MILGEDVRLQREERKRRKKQQLSNNLKLVRRIIISGVLIGLVVYFLVNFEMPGNPHKRAMSLHDEQRVAFIEELLRPLDLSEVFFSMHSETALAINLNNGRVLFDHRGSEKIYPASTTKIMTVLVGLEQASSMDEMVTVNADFEHLWLQGLITAGFTQGEQRPLSDILYGIMLPSGADATESLANHFGGVEHFVQLMNEKAAEIGMTNTHWVNTSGDHDPNHYTTAEDMAKLTIYALQNPQFRAIFTAEEYRLSFPASGVPVLQSTMFNPLRQTFGTNSFEHGRIIGGRTGFTFDAGRCLISLATNDEGVEILLLTFGATKGPAGLNDNTEPLRDAMTIHEYFFNRLAY